MRPGIVLEPMKDSMVIDSGLAGGCHALAAPYPRDVRDEEWTFVVSIGATIPKPWLSCLSPTRIIGGAPSSVTYASM